MGSAYPLPWLVGGGGMRKATSAMIFGAVAVLVGGYFGYKGARQLQYARASNSWPTVQGTVLSSRVESHRKTSGRKHRHRKTVYRADVRYSYTVDGNPFTSNVVWFGQGESSSRSRAAEIVRYYRPGAKVQVFYKPSDPGVAALRPGGSRGPLLTLGLGALGLVAGVVSLVLGYRKRQG